MPRRNPLIALKVEHLTESHDLSSEDIDFLKSFCIDDNNDQRLFWCMANLLKPLVDWGSHFANFLHACPCPKPCGKNCNLKGRRAIDMACGSVNKFTTLLKRVYVPKQASLLLEGSEFPFLLTEWNAAKSAMELRVIQSFSFWTMRPWNLLRMAEGLMKDEPWTVCLNVSFVC